MLLGETIGVALGALRANKLRSFLTMLGVVIGVGAVIAVVALGRGAQESVNARISALGTTLLTVQPGRSTRPVEFRPATIARRWWSPTRRRSIRRDQPLPRSSRRCRSSSRFST